MKKSGKIALCGIFGALAVVIMLTAYFPYATYAIPAVAGMLFAVINIEAGAKWAFGAYASAAIITLIFCEKESAMIFVFFFGYYPILKGIIEGKNFGVLEKVIKHIIFSLTMVAAYVIIVNVFGIPLDETGEFGKWFSLVFLLLGNVVFYIYDIGLTRVIMLYINRYHTKISKLFK